MISKEYTILAAEGIHARPATNLIRLTKKFKSAVSLKKDDKLIKLNSMLNILSLGAKGGDVVTILVDGEDETEAFAAIDNFFSVELNHM